MVTSCNALQFQVESFAENSPHQMHLSKVLITPAALCYFCVLFLILSHRFTAKNKKTKTFCSKHYYSTKIFLFSKVKTAWYSEAPAPPRAAKKLFGNAIFFVFFFTILSYECIIKNIYIMQSRSEHTYFNVCESVSITCSCVAPLQHSNPVAQLEGTEG